MAEENKNLRYYQKLREVPEEAKKEIKGGRLQGMTDINPQFRIGRMTEVFGPCGIGWKYEITKQWQETYGQEVKAFTNINLYIKDNGEWSDPIPGTGGATLVEISKNGMYVSDEGFKMSLTDALSVAMKALGVAGDVYFGKGVKLFNSKYESEAQPAKTTTTTKTPKPTVQTPPKQTADEAQLDVALLEVRESNTIQDLNATYLRWPAFKDNKTFLDACHDRKVQIQNKAQ